MCAGYNPLGLLFIVSSRGMAAAGKTQACLLASGKAQTATVLKCFDLSSAVVLQGLLLKGHSSVEIKNQRPLEM